MPRAIRERRDDDVGGGEPGADVGDRAGDDHAARPASARTAGVGLAADDGEARIGPRADQRQHLVGEPGDRLDIGRDSPSGR